VFNVATCITVITRSVNNGNAIVVFIDQYCVLYENTTLHAIDFISELDLCTCIPVLSVNKQSLIRVCFRCTKITIVVCQVTPVKPRCTGGARVLW